MRLICPNCGAQYEVADDVIPDTGRDVQCSNCGTTWFEQPAALGATEQASAWAAPEPAPVAEPEPEPAPPPAAPPITVRRPAVKQESVPVRDEAPEPTPEPAPVTTPASASRPPPAVSDVDQYDDEPATFADAADLGPANYPPGLRVPKRPISPQIADILREEAAREEAARRAEARLGVETQAEFSLTETSAADQARAEEARRAARRRAAEQAPTHPGKDPTMTAVATIVATSTIAMEVRPAQPQPEAAPTPAAPRRDLLPDIEEINSTLRSAAERGPVAAARTAEAAEAQKRGFRYGFSLILLLAAALAMVYVYTPRIIVMMPGAAPILKPYADAVDDGRLWLDLELQEVLKWITPEDATPPAPADAQTGG